MKKIGAGAFGTVRKAYLKSDPEKKFAVKSLKIDLVEQEIDLLEQELQVMYSVDHPNIVKVIQTYKDQDYFHIVMECCQGRELYEELQEINKFEEVQAAKIIKQVLQAITHLHGINIVHRDIKPENMLVEKTETSY